MTEVRYVRPENRLAKLLVQPGGTRASTLLERAELGVETLRQSTLLAIDRKIDDIAAFVSSSDPHRFAAIRQYAAELFGDAGAFGLTEIALAAGSMYDLLEFDEAPPSTTALAVHLDAIRALRRPSVSNDTAARQAVLAALQELSQSFAAHVAKVSQAEIDRLRASRCGESAATEATTPPGSSLVPRRDSGTPVMLSSAPVHAPDRYDGRKTRKANA